MDRLSPAQVRERTLWVDADYLPLDPQRRTTFKILVDGMRARLTWVTLTQRLRRSLQPVVTAADCAPAAEARVPDT